MQLSIIHDQINYLTNTTGGASGSYSDSDMSTNITRWAHLLTTEIKDSMDDWDFQFETAITDLTADQREYIFPSNLLVIKKIQLKLDGTNWKDAAIFDPEETGSPISSETDITNKFTNDAPYIDIGDRSFFIYSGTISTVSSGIKIWYIEENVGRDTSLADITSFSADTDTPNIAESFQRILIYGACLDYFIKYEIDSQADRMEARIERNIEKMKKFYGQRSQGQKCCMSSATSMEDYE